MIMKIKCFVKVKRTFVFRMYINAAEIVTTIVKILIKILIFVINYLYKLTIKIRGSYINVFFFIDLLKHQKIM